MSKIAALIPSILMSLSACSGDSGTHPDYSHCKTAASLVLVDPNDSQATSPILALPKGVETDIGLEARDADGNLCDPSKVELTFDDDSQIEVVSQGDKTVLKHRFDWFDFGAEPATMMHASLGGIEARWPANGVIDLDGTWTVTIYETKIYPDGYPFGKVIFSQHGRQVKWEDCTIKQACEKALTILNDHVSSSLEQVDFVLDGSISPDRGELGGAWSASSYMGTWSATRL